MVHLDQRSEHHHARVQQHHVPSQIPGAKNTASADRANAIDDNHLDLMMHHYISSSRGAIDQMGRVPIEAACSNISNCINANSLSKSGYLLKTDSNVLTMCCMAAGAGSSVSMSSSLTCAFQNARNRSTSTVNLVIDFLFVSDPNSTSSARLFRFAKARRAAQHASHCLFPSAAAAKHPVARKLWSALNR